MKNEVDFAEHVPSAGLTQFVGILQRKDAHEAGMVEQTPPLERAPDPWGQLPPILPPFGK